MPHPCRRGDFVDCFFPFAERPDEPGPMRHIGYVQTLARLRDGQLRAIVLLTTTSPHMIKRIPAGLSITVSAAQSAALGMRNAFAIDIHRLAVLPLDPVWFPDIGDTRFVLAKADAHLQEAITRRYDEMRARHPNPATVLGPPSGIQR
jgi:hypothetical protein